MRSFKGGALAVLVLLSACASSDASLMARISTYILAMPFCLRRYCGRSVSSCGSERAKRASHVRLRTSGLGGYCLPAAV